MTWSDYEAVFNELYAKDAKVQRLIEKLMKSATYEDANQYAIKIGKILSNTINQTGALSGELTADEVRSIIDPALKNNYQLASDAAGYAQEAANQKAGIGLKSVKPELRQDRVDGIVTEIADKGYDNITAAIEDQIINLSQSAIDDTVKANADFQYNSGLSPKIIRKTSGKCCEWCDNLAGTYSYPDVPKDIYRRHNNCRCTVEYDPGDGKKKRQDVWSKVWQTAEKSDKIIKSEKIIKDKDSVAKLLNITNANKISIPSKKIDTGSLGFDEEHIKVKGRNIGKEEAVQWINNSRFSIDVWNGKFTKFFSDDGTTYVNNETQIIRTAYSKNDFTQNIIDALKVIKND